MVSNIDEGTLFLLSRTHLFACLCGTKRIFWDIILKVFFLWKKQRIGKEKIAKLIPRENGIDAGCKESIGALSAFHLSQLIASLIISHPFCKILKTLTKPSSARKMVANDAHREGAPLHAEWLSMHTQEDFIQACSESQSPHNYALNYCYCVKAICILCSMRMELIFPHPAAHNADLTVLSTQNQQKGAI